MAKDKFGETLARVARTSNETLGATLYANLTGKHPPPAVPSEPDEPHASTDGQIVHATQNFDKNDRAGWAAASLEDATEKMNAVVSEAEQTFKALNLGVAAKVCLDEVPNMFSEHLTFRKDGKDWRLLVIYEATLGAEHSQESPLINASRENRVRALAALPRLYAALVTAAEIQSTTIESEVAKAEEFLKTLRVK